MAHRIRLIGRGAPIATVGAALAIYPFLVKDPFWQNLAVLVLVNATAASAWNILGGYSGQISFGHSVFFGIGAYTTGYLLVRHDLTPWWGLLAGALFAVAAGLVIGFPVFRLRSHYFSIATIAVQQVVFSLVVNNQALGAGTGLELPIKESSLASLQFSARDKTAYHLVALALFGFASLAAWLFVRGRLGAYARAIRDDEDVARALGVRVRRSKLYAIALSAGLTAVAGAFYGMYVLFVDPHSVLSLNRSIEIALVSVLGGAGTLWGPLVGAWVLGTIQQLTRVRFSGGGNTLDLVIYGTLVVAIAILEPAGLMGLTKRLRRWGRSS